MYVYLPSLTHSDTLSLALFISSLKTLLLLFSSHHLLLAVCVSHQQGVFVGLGQRHTVERELVGAQGVDGGAAVVDEAVEQAELGRGPSQLAHADVHAHVRQAARTPPPTHQLLQLLNARLIVTMETSTQELAVIVVVFVCVEDDVCVCV